jgi:hypothetical protein
VQLGRQLRELSGMRVGLAISAVLAVFAGFWAADRISLSPPGLKPRALQMAAASTEALVDAPRSSVLDLSVDTYDLQSLTNRALLVGNVMASAPVRRYIARRAQVPEDRLQVLAPLTVDFPRPLSTELHPKPTDLFASPNEYRVSIEVNPTVPALDIRTQAPTTAEAARLASGAIAGMQDYLRDLGRSQNVKPTLQVHLVELGAPRAGVLARRAGLTIAILAALFTFIVSCCAVVAISRTRRGWVQAGSSAAPEPSA